jgi:hypothetical protein
MIWRPNPASPREQIWPGLGSPGFGIQELTDGVGQSSVVLGHDANGKRVVPDSVRVMQGIVLGQTGSGKTTLLQIHYPGSGTPGLGQLPIATRFQW